MFICMSKTLHMKVYPLVSSYDTDGGGCSILRAMAMAIDMAIFQRYRGNNALKSLRSSRVVAVQLRYYLRSKFACVIWLQAETFSMP